MRASVLKQGRLSQNQLPLASHVILVDTPEKARCDKLWAFSGHATKVRLDIGGTANTFLLLSIVLMIVVVSRQIYWLDGFAEQLFQKWCGTI